MPIDSSTRMASRATLRDTPCCALTPSRVSTCPARQPPRHDLGAERVEQVGVQLADVWLPDHGIHLVIALLAYKNISLQ